MSTNRFSKRMESVIRLSREEAIRLGHDYIGTEHLLLGIIREGEGVAVKILRNLGVDLHKLKETIDKAVRPVEPTLVIGNVPLTKQAERVLKITYLEATLYKSYVIGTEHLLLSLLRDGDNLATQILSQFNVTYDGVRVGLDKLISGLTAPDAKPQLEMTGAISPSLAAAFALGAHSAINQRRKYTFEPYFAHCKNVAFLVASCKDVGIDVMSAAYLHDVVEDTAVTLETIEQLLGKRVAQLVSEVTDVSTPLDGNRAQRKALDRAHLAKASPDGMTIKLADLIDNTRSIVAHDPDFAKIYMREKRALLQVLQGGHPMLLAQATKQVEGYFQSTESIHA